MTLSIAPHQFRSHLPIYWHCNITCGKHFVHVTARSPQAAYRKAKAQLKELEK